MQSDMEKPVFENNGVLLGHNGWVTAIVAGHSKKEEEDSKMLISASRDRTIIVWRLNLESKTSDTLFGQPQKQLKGHDHFINDLALSGENLFALSASWDKTMRLWDLQKGVVAHKFKGHEKEVNTCCFSPDNRVILSGGCDKAINLWNVKGKLKWTIRENNHSDWVSRIRYSPTNKLEFFASTGWGGKLKIWNKQFQIRYSFKAHDGPINALAISPVGQHIATGGKDNILKIWDIENLKKATLQYKTRSEINDIKFNPSNQWIAAATNKGISIWDL